MDIGRLDHVLRLGVVPDDRAGGSEQALVMALDQDANGAFIARAGVGDEIREWPAVTFDSRNPLRNFRWLGRFGMRTLLN